MRVGVQIQQLIHGRHINELNLDKAPTGVLSQMLLIQNGKGLILDFAVSCVWIVYLDCVEDSCLNSLCERDIG
jgi:hypothetical protein